MNIATVVRSLRFSGQTMHNSVLDENGPGLRYTDEEYDTDKVSLFQVSSSVLIDHHNFSRDEVKA